ncbi:FAD/NAD(P)-binding protein [Kitasatospora mediocidica]|uniref:FAD/NAD(P)-binding protein n=1 Tax=Kitasatospora mediocidica TaxID=58352 RepID=UPI0005636258|nr:FAD/NAD(P)-binding domain-containing protein [Kitasatospora mediocidica]
MTTVNVTIIGMGPRGLSILQRIAELSRELPPGLAMDVHLVDPGDSGQGVHSSRQPAHLLTNTVASQVTMFAGDAGPSFTEWAQEAGYRRFANAYYRTGDGSGEAVGPHDYLPRSLLGEYLSWVFDRTVRSLPPRVRVVHHRARALDMEQLSGSRFAVRVEDGFEIRSDFVFLATGHGARTPSEDDTVFEEFVRENAVRNDHLGYYANPYPVDRLQRIAPGAAVAVQGFGLTAHDVVAALTVGRGGRFEGTDADLRYVPSGREPSIQLFSRQCLPLSARGVNQKGVAGQYVPSFFTPDAVRALRERARQSRGDARLEFEAEALPLLLREMGYAYRTVREQRHIPAQDYEFGPEDRAAIEAVVDPLRGRTFTDLDDFRRFFVDFVTADLEEAELGNMTSPVKAATDVVRDVRQSLRDAVEFAGLTPESHRVFNAGFVPLMNRIAFGPPRQRNYELLALIAAGVVDLAGGPGCRLTTDPQAARFAIASDFAGGTTVRHVDALVIARLDLFHPESDSSPLAANLLARGLVRPFANGPYKPGGLDVDDEGRLLTKAGTALPNAYAVGYPVEGPRYYTYYLPRAGMRSRFTDDAEACVRAMWARLQQTAPIEEDLHADPERKPVSVS